MIWLFLGGTRSGKSMVAERIAAGLAPPVSYVATMLLGTPDGVLEVDDDLVRRVEAHRARRPAEWATVEAGRDLAGVLRRTRGTVLVDSLGPWVAGHGHHGIDRHALCDALAARPGDTVVVSEEVGLGVHPETEWGRHFRDELGALNQAVAAIADRVALVVAGRILPLEPLEPVDRGSEPGPRAR